MSKILFLVAHRPGRSPGQRFRFEQYLDFLQQKGFNYEISFLLNEEDDACFYSKGHYFRKLGIFFKSIRIRLNDVRRSSEFDVIFIYREAVMFGSAWFERRLKRKGARMILDFDDAIWLMDVSEGNRNLRWLKKPSKTSGILKLMGKAIVGNSFLAAYASAFNKDVWVIPTTIDTDIFKRLNLPKNPEKIYIGWIGSHTTMKHFELALGVLKMLNEKYPGKISIKLISDTNYPTDDIAIDFCKWNKDTEIADLSAIDIGIMPLPDNDWARGKCGFKGLQYMALEIPAVMSPVGVNIEIIQDGVNGFLASSEEEWIMKLSMLIESAELRERIGKAGRQTVVENYSYERWKGEFLKCLKEATVPT